MDTYTQTGVMWSQRINSQWMVQAAIHSGTDMAPWYPGAIPTGAFGVALGCQGQQRCRLCLA